MMGATMTVLPQINGGIYLTDGGTETFLMYKKGFELPHFSAFHLLNDSGACEVIRKYYRDHAAVAQKYETGFIYCSLTYRASRDWGKLLGYSTQGLAEMNHKAIDLYRSVAAEFRGHEGAAVFSGCIGPRGDAYQLSQEITAEEAEAYHLEQIETFEQTGADMVTALTLNNIDEAIGIARAAQSAGMPSVISFTLDEHSKLKTGPSIKEAIEQVDKATDGAPAYYMINCSHPIEFGPALGRGNWMKRLGGIRPNASSMTKGVLCKLGHLEQGDPVELGQQMGDVARKYPHINVWGGCCGTDHVHVDEICKNIVAARTEAASSGTIS
jgi:S-methylmethionine-dependent homocysteine/selenocysteine methylase